MRCNSACPIFTSLLVILGSHAGEVEEPHEMIHDDEYTGYNEDGGCQVNERPGMGEVLEVEDVTDDGEHCQCDRQGIRYA